MADTARIRYPDYLSKIMSAEDAAQLIQYGMTVGISGFTKSGDVKKVPLALAARAREEALQINLWTGASLGDNTDGILAESGILHKRLPFQADKTMRKAINNGDVLFIDQHLSQIGEMLRSQHIAKVDVAIIEACALLEDGSIVPTTSVGNSAIFADSANEIIIELNEAQPLGLYGLHDIYTPAERPNRQPIPLVKPSNRIGTPSIHIDPGKVVAVVMTNQPDSPSSILPADDETEKMAGHLIDFFKHEFKMGRLGPTLMPLQSGIGTTANAVLEGLVDSPFHHLQMYSEVLQDCVLDLLDSGRMDFASASSITLSAPMAKRFFEHLDDYRNKLVLRPQEISNHPEIIRRLGIIAINAALEVDLYGNVNSTHVSGTHMMNGIGGSGDFARNGYLSIFATKSLAKGGKISSIVPMTPHVDHCEHDVDIVITEQGIADLRGLAPRERVPLIINHCAHPSYRELLRDYYKDAVRGGGQTPHNLAEAFSFHLRLAQTGSMMPSNTSVSVQKS